MKSNVFQDWANTISTIIVAAILLIGVIINPFNKLEEKIDDGIDRLDDKISILSERMVRVETHLGLSPWPIAVQKD